jgi:superfamily I DNA/RNA helicase
VLHLSETIKYYGIPGSGKTETILRNIETYIDNGISLDQINYSTFTKLASDDAKDRIAEKFNIHPNYPTT